MALIKCPDCKKKISDQSVNCLHCGCPIQTYIQQQDLNITPDEAEQPKKPRKKIGWIIRIAVLVVVLAVVAIMLWTQDVFTPPFSENTAAIEAADASVVKIFCYDYDGELAATGSGFLVYDSKTVVTNYHVMTSAYTCKISTNLDVSYEVADIICFSKELDLAFLQLAKDTELQPLTFGISTELKKGEAVVAIGSPLGIKNTVSTGVLSGRPMKESMEVLQFTAPISHGSSGGALFDNTGKVIGITFAGIDDGQNLNFAIPAEKASDLYETRQGLKKVSAIYENEHPYITKLAQYEGIPEITIDELLANPGKYNEKTVKVNGYFSSIYSYWTNKYPWRDEPELGEIHKLHITTQANATGNGKADNDMVTSAITCNTRHCYLQIMISDDDRFYINDSIQPGDPISWIGEISYWEYSSGNEIHFSSSTDLCFSVD